MSEPLIDVEINVAEIDDLYELVEHDLRHMAEAGYNDLPAHPFLPGHEFKREDFRNNLFERFNHPVKTTGWGRSFIAVAECNIIAHLNIKNHLETSLHRVQLGMGIEVKYRSQGLGTELLRACINFCKENNIEYIDLSVFSHNLPAIKLYKKLGFVEIANFKDIFRIGNLSVDDIQMTLKL
jgi:RimJ/RimL family protein N-acetyltransferase